MTARGRVETLGGGRPCRITSESLSPAIRSRSSVKPIGPVESATDSGRSSRGDLHPMTSRCIQRVVVVWNTALKKTEVAMVSSLRVD